MSVISYNPITNRNILIQIYVKQIYLIKNQPQIIEKNVSRETLCSNAVVKHNPK